MAQLSALQICQAACYEQLLPAPSSLLNNTDSFARQVLGALHATLRDLRQKAAWPQLKRAYTVFLNSQQTYYQLPQDFFTWLPGTQWDQQNKWQMLGPLGDAQWSFRTYGWVTLENRKAFRIFGGDANPNSTFGGQFAVNPTPGLGQQGLQLTFEYISKSYLQAAPWTPSQSISAGTAYRSCFGNNYSAVLGSTTTCGTVPPNMANGIGLDGGVLWKWITNTSSTWAGSTIYAPGSYVINGSNLYCCVSGGTSAVSGGPSGTSSSTITDGTVGWQYKAVLTWAPQTQYTTSNIVKSGNNYYLSVNQNPVSNNTIYSGSIAPTWTATTVSDGVVTWTYLPAAYEVLNSDTDVPMFDTALTTLGIRYRILAARGVDYSDLKNEYDAAVGSAIGRMNVGATFNMASGLYPAGLSQIIGEGSWNF